jgi:pyruvate-ferredoxin/flavodoxin oxidoreductase
MGKVFQKLICDANEAVAKVAHKTNEVCAIYPITPASPMGEHVDAFSANEENNIWNNVPRIVEMQSEGGAAGAVHGSLQAGALTTTFTASQGLLLMIPNMYKIAGEMLPTVIHVAARTVATHALSIFGDHSDVMATRQTGFAMLFGGSVQEAMDLALISQVSTFRSRVPFLNIFDGFRTSHEVSKIDAISDEIIKAMMPEDKILEFKKRSLDPDHPVLRGTSQNPDVFFQAREAANLYYENVPEIVQNVMDEFCEHTGRRYDLFDYLGHPEAERVIIIMGSGEGAVRETVDTMANQNEKVGVLFVRLYRPFSIDHFIDKIPETVKKIAVLDRTKEPGSIGEPLYLDVVTSFVERKIDMPLIVGGRYGLSSKEFNPAMVKGIYDELLKEEPKNHFTIGINDDVSHTSLTYNPVFKTNKATFNCIFYGLGADGTVGANKNSVKIIGETTDNYVQGYFV